MSLWSRTDKLCDVICFSCNKVNKLVKHMRQKHIQVPDSAGCSVLALTVSIVCGGVCVVCVMWGVCVVWGVWGSVCCVGSVGECVFGRLNNCWVRKCVVPAYSPSMVEQSINGQ